MSCAQTNQTDLEKVYLTMKKAIIIYIGFLIRRGILQTLECLVVAFNHDGLNLRSGKGWVSAAQI